MKAIIDRFEGEWAVLELEGNISKNISLSMLPHGVKEGDVIIFSNDKWCFDKGETEKLKTEIDKLAEDLFT